MGRNRAATVAAIGGLSCAGIVVAHHFAYLFASGGGSHQHQLLEHTGHGHWPYFVGEEVTEAVDSVTWTGGSIEPGEFDEFGFSIRTPDDAGELEFPALQTYEGGEVVRWIGPADADEPAALVNVIDTGFAEKEGQLSVSARLNQSLGEPSEQETQQTAASEDDSDDSNLGVILGGIGILLGGVALSLALRKPA